MTRRELILATVRDLVVDLLHYDRREDEDLPVDAIEEAIANGEVMVDEILEEFCSQLRKKLT